ncbi:5517_t:CDS:2, partial [Gigaspora margarita]
MYRIDRNNYHQNSKNSDIQTPLEVSEFIYQILKKRIPIETGDEKYSLIFDPDKIIELFGKEIPIVLFTPTGLCSNLTTKSPRHKKFVNGDYPPVSSIIRLPKNIFPN